MQWLLWALLFVGIVLLVLPLLGIMSMATATIVWLIGGLVLLGAAAWAIITLGRAGAPVLRTTK